jgi:hypothetical protein
MFCTAPSPFPISLDDAITAALQEMQRRGIGETHRVAALRGAPDATAEGAAFAATIFPRTGLGADERGGRLKFLIEPDGRVSVRSWRGRRAALPRNPR